MLAMDCRSRTFKVFEMLENLVKSGTNAADHDRFSARIARESAFALARLTCPERAGPRYPTCLFLARLLYQPTLDGSVDKPRY
jgi:hypothetical protein